jgi:hypothetical protein
MEGESFRKSLLYGGGFSRSLIKRQDLRDNPGLANFLRGVLASGMAIDALKPNADLNHCYKSGWLQSELIVDKDDGEGRKVCVSIQTP